MQLAIGEKMLCSPTMSYYRFITTMGFAGPLFWQIQASQANTPQAHKQQVLKPINQLIISGNNLIIKYLGGRGGGGPGQFIKPRSTLVVVVVVEVVVVVVVVVVVTSSSSSSSCCC
jgi:hypothetical protein